MKNNILTKISIVALATFSVAALTPVEAHSRQDRRDRYDKYDRYDRRHSKKSSRWHHAPRVLPAPIVISRPVVVQRPVYVSHTEAAVQRELARRGYYRGVVDGQIGPQTRASIRAYQIDRGLPVTGVIDHRLLRALRLA